MKRELDDRRRSKRLDYEKPRILSREKLEVVAVACSPGKATVSGDPNNECNNFLNS